MSGMEGKQNVGFRKTGDNIRYYKTAAFFQNECIRKDSKASLPDRGFLLLTSTDRLVGPITQRLPTHFPVSSCALIYGTAIGIMFDPGVAVS
jgi:hypothetical protein